MAVKIAQMRSFAVAQIHGKVKSTRSKAWQVALDLFQDVSCLRVCHDSLNLDDIILACARTRRWESTLDVLKVMQQSCISANAFTYSAAMSAFSRVKRWSTALRLLADANESSVRMDTVLYGTAITAWEKGHRWEHALSMLRHMLCSYVQASTATCNAAISACEKGNKWEIAADLLAEMESLQVSLDIISYNAAISAYEKRGKWTCAIRLLSDAQSRRMLPDVITYSAVISSCEKGNQWEHALFLLSHMQHFCVPASTVAYSAAISACEKSSQLDAAIALWEDMKFNNIPADTIAHNAMISTCDKGMQWRLALQHFEAMTKADVKNSSISYYATMKACERAGKWEIAMGLISEMLERGVPECATGQVAYMHHIQAGSVVDCFKHLVLIHVLEQMSVDSSPFTYLDAHAGAGIYDLHSPQAKSHGNAEHGVKLLYHYQSNAHCFPETLKFYLGMLRELNKASTSENDLSFYLGSPAWALKCLRPQDKAVLLEKNTNVCKELRYNLELLGLKPCTNFTVVGADSYRWLTQTARSEFLGRVLVLLDPPYDSYDSYTAWNLYMVRHVCRHWQNSSVMLWYPCRNPAELSSFYQRVQCLQLGKVLVAEFDAKRSSDALNHCGMLIVNPPPNIDAQLETLLPVLGRALASGTSAEYDTSVFWLSKD